MPRKKIEFQTQKKDSLLELKSGRSISGDILPVICERIAFYREKRGMGQKELAVAAGVTANSVSNWENGRSRPDVNLLPSICTALGITLYELFDISDPKPELTEKQKKLIEGYERLSPGHRSAVEGLITSLAAAEESENCPELRVLMYFSRTLAAGIGDPTEFEESAEPVYLYATALSRQADCIFRINGDSMEPKFHSGQEVLVQRIRDNGNMKYGEIGAFIVGNETYIKKYEPDGLHSLNPDYPVMHFEDEEAVYLIGRVIGTLEPEDHATEEDIERSKLSNL